LSNVDSFTYISLYSGGGGLDLGFRLANPHARTVCYVERDAAACAVLVGHMQTGELDDAPVWTDSGTFDGEPWRDRVDWIIGGFPCQPASVAGQRAGLDDARWLWPHIARIVSEVQPSGVFLENVPGLLTVNDGAAFREIVGDLAALGFDAEWDRFRASDVGAPHRRERLFILAYRNGKLSHLQQRAEGAESHRGRETLAHTAGAGTWDFSGPTGGRERPQDVRQGDGPTRAVFSDPASGDDVANACDISRQVPQAGERAGAHSDHAGAPAGHGDTPEHASEQLAYAAGQRLQRPESIRQWDNEQPRPSDECSSVVNTDNPRPQGRGEPLGEGQHEQLAWPPGPTDTDAWAAVLAQRPTLEPAVCGMADGVAHRVDRLRILGNGVVPAQAALAFRELATRMEQS